MANRARISGPLLDRIDLHIEVPSLPRELLNTNLPTPESSAVVRARVRAAREFALSRQGKANSALGNREVDKFCKLGDAERRLLEQAIDRLGLSARAYHRLLRVARTIADLASEQNITSAHIAEAIGYRKIDRASR